MGYVLNGKTRLASKESERFLIATVWTTSFYNFVYSNYLNCKKGGKEGKEQDHKVDSIIYK